MPIPSLKLDLDVLETQLALVAEVQPQGLMF